MKNKKVLAIALAAAMAITAVIPSVSFAASHKEAVTGTKNVTATSSELKTLVTTTGGILTTSGSVGAKLESDTVTFTTTTSSTGNVVSVDGFGESKTATIYAEVTEGDAYISDDEETITLDLTKVTDKKEFKVYFIENTDTDNTVTSVVKFYCGEPSEKHQIAEITYVQSKASKGGSSSGGGAPAGKTTVLPDGSKQTVTTVTTSTGTVTTTTTVKPDGSKTIVKKVVNKDGSGSVTETSITKAGTEKTVEIVTDKTGAVVEVATFVSNAKGVSAKMSYTASGSKVTLKKVETKGKTAVSIPATIKCDGKTFKVTKIAAAAVKGNKEIKKVTVGKNVTAIGKNAFKGDSKLKTIILKGKVTSVGKNAFKSVYKKATFKIAKANFKTVKKAVKKSGVAKTVKYKKA